MLNSLQLSLSSLIDLAADLHASGAVRSEQGEKFGLLRTGLDQFSGLIDTVASEVATPSSPDAAAFNKLLLWVDDMTHHLETLALTVDHAADQVAALVEKAA